MVLHGLLWSTELNGRKGVIVGRGPAPDAGGSGVEAAAQSVVVRLDGDGREVSVKAERLLPA